MRAQHCTGMPRRFTTTELVRDVGARGRLLTAALPTAYFETILPIDKSVVQK